MIGPSLFLNQNGTDKEIFFREIFQTVQKLRNCSFQIYADSKYSFNYLITANDYLIFHYITYYFYIECDNGIN